MTEKGFYSIGSSLYNNTQCISDKPITNFKSKHECKKVCELLNGLQDGLVFYRKQNAYLSEQLKECLDARKAYKDDWKACVSYCDTYEDEIYTYKDNIEGLKEENEELKKENKIHLREEMWLLRFLKTKGFTEDDVIKFKEHIQKQNR